VGFGSDGILIMIGKQNRIAARLKENVNNFLTSIHYVTHRTNLAAIGAIQSGSCKNMSKEIYTLLNSVAMHFKNCVKEKMHCCDCKKNLLILQNA
jgi:hypothetical protein